MPRFVPDTKLCSLRSSPPLFVEATQYHAIAHSSANYSASAALKPDLMGPLSVMIPHFSHIPKLAKIGRAHVELQ